MMYKYKGGPINNELLDYLYRAQGGGDDTITIGSLVYRLHPLDVRTLAHVYGLILEEEHV